MTFLEALAASRETGKAFRTKDGSTWFHFNEGGTYRASYGELMAQNYELCDAPAVYERD